MNNTNEGRFETDYERHQRLKWENPPTLFDGYFVGRITLHIRETVPHGTIHKIWTDADEYNEFLETKEVQND